MNVLDPKSLLKIEEQFLTQSKNELYQNLPELWDPTGKIDVEKIKQNSYELDAKYKYLCENPNIIKNQMITGLKIGLIGTIILVPLNYYTILGKLGGYYFLVIPWLFFLVQSFLLYNDEIEDIIKLQIAKKNNWLYDPAEDPVYWEYLEKEIPSFFRKGLGEQKTQNMFWGDINKKNKKYYFHGGEFKYNLSNKNFKIENYIILYNEKKVETAFKLVKSTPKNKASKKEIRTESNEFNKRFSFVYNGNKEEEELEIMKVLSPRVQEELIKLHDKNKDIIIIFQDNYIIISEEGPILKNIKTSFNNSHLIDKRDIDFLEEKLNSLSIISAELLKHLD